MMHDYRDLSRRKWSHDDKGGTANPDTSDIQLGALLRIADALETQAKFAEVMAQNFTNLQASLEYYKNDSKRKTAEINSKNATIRTLKGHLTRTKNKAGK